MSDIRQRSLDLHRKNKGKLGFYSKVPVQNAEDLSLAYSPGVAEPCMEIYNDEKAVYDYTNKGNLVAVISDGTAVLGLGDIGPKAAIPVMDGKAILFKVFADVDAFPICLNTTDVDKIVETVKLLEPNFGGVNLEDISSPRCFEIEERLKNECGIPVFHDDQHGTAIVTTAGLVNALKLVGKSMEAIRVVVNGAGAAGIAIIKLLVHLGVKEILLCDTKGIIYEGRSEGMNSLKEEIAKITNHGLKSGSLADAIDDADVFIGVSAAGALSSEMVKTMNEDAIIFAMANPIPEIMPGEALEAGAKVVGTGRSDFPNQVNNVLAFPGIFRGALDVQASCINEEMKIAAVYAIADLILATELKPDYIIPHPFDKRVAASVAKAVSKAAIDTGVARGKIKVEA
ncbi:NAD(P)-dependent malic enzyme [Mesobacillus harenae]|uniref:NAD(P)-dependent malic enzyme n=1 Tax=Mesobacillus harenae TaxID=2213203 RepID=UPI00157FCE98|nr:malic enzyme-like NAD(P)-binding protein [Mesobacillus harenae]